ncbi:carbohydrate-binding protein [Gilvimarinus algae]|uniref:Carbohydrate-binding protein n=1 Tax=Gilvimarinus algae TaxID=3058037 RepID=A0ABT8T9U9_9GAMM|nr:carbohydrate-binding protein [Gilvimarinus sp. SDUM040014]MDO3380763.1 carbohydrate-binding protein [Gilvimarinus sp. SDUM040014]
MAIPQFHNRRLWRRAGLLGAAVASVLLPAGESLAQTNLAQGKNITASSMSDVYGPANANDGNAASYWESANNAFPQTLTLDLGAVTSVERLQLMLPDFWGSRTQTLAVLGSTDGSSYTSLAASGDYVFDPANLNRVTVDFADTDTRFVRLRFTGNSGWPAGQLSELQVFGSTTNEPISAFSRIEAESFDNMQGIQTEATSDQDGGSNIGWIDNGDWIMFDDVDFASGAYSVEARVASNHSGGTIQLHLDSPNGELIGSVPVGYTGGWQSWVTQSTSVYADGLHDLYLVFEGSASGGMFNVNWLEFSAGTDVTPPAIPTGVQVTATTASSVSLSWNASANAEGYDVLRNGAVVGSTTGTQYQDTGLAAGTSYDYAVRAYNSDGESSPSAAITATTDNDGTPPAGDNVADGKPVSASSGHAYHVAANAVDGNRASYWESSGALPQFITVDLGSAHYVNQVTLQLPDDMAWESRTQTVSVLASDNGSAFSTLAGATPLDFDPAMGNSASLGFAETSARYVRVEVSGNTAWSAAQIAELQINGYPDPVPPPTPANLTVTGQTDTAVFLSWAGSEQADGYQVLRDDNVIADVSAANYQDTGLTPETSYGYSVLAYNAFGSSSPTASVTATTLAEGSGGDPDHPEPNGEHGANMPYDRYDTGSASYGGGAELREAPNFDQLLTASEASGQSYIALPSNGAYAEWTIRDGEGGRGVTMRFTMPDSADGMGLDGSLDVLVNGVQVQTVPLTSYYNYQYFTPGGGHPADTPAGGNPLFRFDETHWMLSTALEPGDVIRIEKTNGDALEYGVDFLEIEPVSAPIARPGNSVAVTDFGAIANDGQDDLAAFNQAVDAARSTGQSLYIPPGTFHLDNMWVIGSVGNEIDDITIMGAGIWHTKLQFTNPNAASGGISFRVLGQLDFSHVYMNSMLRSRYNQQAIYKAFMDNFGTDSRVHNVWVEHFECGFWVGDYAHTPAIIADNLLIEHSRVRNNLADGINFAQGTSNSTVRNSSIRNNGDDGLAVWTSNVNGAPPGVNNTFTHNTIEFNWRAAGIAFFGGSGHQATYNLIVDGIGSSGFRMNTVFPGYHFQNNTGIVFSDSTIIRSGTSLDTWGGERGAIDLEASTDPIRNLTISNIDIYDTQRSAIQMGYGGGFENVVFNDIVIDGTGLDGVTTSRFAGPHPGAAIYSYTNNGTATFNNLSTSNVAHPDTHFVPSGFNLIIQ